MGANQPEQTHTDDTNTRLITEDNVTSRYTLIGSLIVHLLELCRRQIISGYGDGNVNEEVSMPLQYVSKLPSTKFK